MLDHAMTDPTQLEQHICCSVTIPRHCKFKMNIEQVKRNGMQLHHQPLTAAEPSSPLAFNTLPSTHCAIHGDNYHGDNYQVRR
jgi:hypothetical protein